MIQLLMFGACPWPEIHRCVHYDRFIIGGRYGNKELLFCVIVCYHNGTKKLKAAEVYLFRLDTGRIKWEDLECLKKWDLTGFNMEEYEVDCTKDFDITRDMWEEMNNLKDTAIFYVDLGRDRTIFHNPAVASDELLGGGYIYIRDKMDGILHLYHVRDKTIMASPMPSRVVSTTHVSMWEGTRQLEEEDDHVEANWTGTSIKQEKDERVVTLDEDLNNNESSRLLDVLEMLLEHCVGVEYLNLRATCKLCCLALPPIRWSNETSRTRLHNCSLTLPWLMVANKHRGGTISFTDPLSGDNYFVKKNSQVLSIVNDRMYCSRYGWLLFESREYKCPVLFNPFTSDVRKLPNFGEILCLCLSASPTTNSSSNNNNCIVAGFAYDEGQDYLIYSVGVGGDQWRFVPLGNDDWHIYALLTFIGRDLYALGEGRQVIVFKNLGGEERIRKTVLANAPPLMMVSSSSSRETRNYFLMSCDDEHLLLVIVGDECREIEVFKRNDDEDKWEKIDGIGKHTIFIGGTTSICVDAKMSEMENKIYFPQLVWYSLETHTYHASSDGKIMKRYFQGFVGAKSHLNCHAWIQPSWC
ncbi:uncharacterized protein [Rutidosis leptorrhynchoides]|uniref:uncharacterized protein n=1 Tax=Rutidosis leptorrhynchoides TaxID=125765 RepID=UPI003A99FD3E